MIFAKNNKNSRFIMGVADVFALNETDDMVVVGNVSGTVHIGDTVSIINFGEDNAQTFSGEICEIEINKNTVDSVTDSFAALRIKSGSEYGLKTGTVIYSGDHEMQDMYNNYAVAFMAQMDVVGLKEQTLRNASLSECAEIVRTDHLLVKRKNIQRTNAELQKQSSIINGIIREKLYDSDHIYCVYSRSTGEPYMKSDVYKNGDRLSAAPPVLILITEAFLPFAELKYPSEFYELRKILNGKEKNGIEKFLGFGFYVNGAAGVSLLYDEVVVPAYAFISQEEHNKKYPLPLPVTNPEIQALSLLIDQIGQPKTDDEKTILDFFYKLIVSRMSEAVMLVPVSSDKKENADEGPDMPVVKTEDDRYAVPVFTDAVHFLSFFGDKYDAIANKISLFTDKYDIVINPSDKNPNGCYFSREMLERLKSI